MVANEPLNPIRIFDLWLGRAGAGKTYGCISAIAHEIQHSPRGLPLLFIVPEQASVQMERRLLEQVRPLGGFTRARVISFRHLRTEATAAAGAPPRDVLDELGRVTLIQRLLHRLRGGLRLFKPGASGPQLAQSVSAMLLEFQRYGWSREDLTRRIEALPGGPGEMLNQKLTDLHDIWAAYETALEEADLDDGMHRFDAVVQTVAAWEGLAGARVWIDGFGSFTAQEFALIEAVANQAQSITLALCLDPAQLAGHEGIANNAARIEWGEGIAAPAPTRKDKTVGSRVGPERLFEPVLETATQAVERMHGLGWQVRLRGLPERHPTRFEGRPALMHLERDVLGRCVARPYEAELPPAIATGLAALEFIEADDRRAEVEAVARRIAALCRNDTGGARPTAMTWRDIAVLARSLEPYETLVRQVFAQWAIPAFIDRPREMIAHPLARLVLTALQLVRQGAVGSLAIRHLRTGLSGLRDRPSIDRLENHILASDPIGRGWREKLSETPTLAEAWQRAAAPLNAFYKELKAGRPASRVLWNYVQSVEAAATLDGWIAGHSAEGDETTAQLHEHAWEAFVGWLEQLDRLASRLPGLLGEPDDPPEARLDLLIELVETGLAQTTARLIPPTLNQVTVGAIDRSRTPEIKLAFVLGVNDGEFPKQWTPDPMLNDEDRDVLTRQAKRLGPDTAQKRIGEYYLSYIAMTRASAHLIVCRPLLNDQGKSAQPSALFTALLEAYPTAPRHRVRRRGLDESPELPIRIDEWHTMLQSLVTRVESEAGRREAAGLLALGDPLQLRGIPERQAAMLRLARRRLAPMPEARIPAELAREFWRERQRIRVTGLETYGACPYRFFARLMLELRERKSSQLNQMELGSIRHNLLESLFPRLGGGQPLRWGDVKAEAADEAIDELLDRQVQHPDFRERVQGDALMRLEVERIRRDMKLFVRGLMLVSRRSATTQLEAERKIRMPLELSDDIELTVSGTVDRLDGIDGVEDRIIYDYKSGRKLLDLSGIAAGTELQLALYAQAIGNVAGIFYWPLGMTLKTTGGGEDDIVLDKDWFKAVGPRGLFDKDIFAALDGEVDPGGPSLAYNFRLTGKGEINNTGSSHWPRRGLDRLYAIAGEHAQRWAGQLLAGEIRLHPVRRGPRLACEQCDLSAVCRRDEQTVPERVVEPVNRKSLLAQWEEEAS